MVWLGGGGGGDGWEPFSGMPLVTVSGVIGGRCLCVYVVCINLCRVSICLGCVVSELSV